MNLVNLTIPYGRGSVQLDVDKQAESVFICKPRELVAFADAEGALGDSLNSPIASSPLKDLLSTCESVLLVLSDPTRALAYPLWIRSLLDYVAEHARPSAKIRYIVATGSHRGFSDSEMLEYLGMELPVIMHNSRDDSSLVFLGRTGRGTPIYLNQEISNADLIITTSRINFHYFSGFTGGIKAIFPGLAGETSIIHNHGLSLDRELGTFHKACRPGNFEGNPVYEDFLEVVSKIPRVFSINVILNGDEKPVAFFCGDVIEAHRQACEFYSQHFSVYLRERVSRAILSAGGFPKDISLYQAHKALKSIEQVLSPNAKVMFFAECAEGLGHAKFPEWLGVTRAKVVERLKKAYEPLSHLMLSLLTITENYEVYLFSSLAESDAKSLGFIPVKLVDAQKLAEEFLRECCAERPLLVQLYGSEIQLNLLGEKN